MECENLIVFGSVYTKLGYLFIFDLISNAVIMEIYSYL